MNKVNYDAVLSDLRARKRQIENAIHVIESLIGGQVLSGTPQNEAESGLQDTINGLTDTTADEKGIVPSWINHEGRIQREDIVECVKVHQRDAGIDEDLIPIVGKQYRVIDIYMKDGKVSQYDVLDDESGNKIRMPIIPDEIKLARKRKPQPPRVMVFSTTTKCEACGEETALNLRQDTVPPRYEGDCINCGVHIKLDKQQPAAEVAEERT